MQDLNFFSVLKKQKNKNKTLRIVLISILILVLILNAVVIGMGMMATKKLNDKISQNKAYLNSNLTKEKIKEAQILSKEVGIAAEYLKIINKVAGNFNSSNLIRVKLLDDLRGMAPVSTYFEAMEINENKINLKCFTKDVNDPMNFYHKLLQDSRFTDVKLPGFSLDASGTITFDMVLTLKGGEQA